MIAVNGTEVGELVVSMMNFAEDYFHVDHRISGCGVQTQAEGQIAREGLLHYVISPSDPTYAIQFLGGTSAGEPCPAGSVTFTYIGNWRIGEGAVETTLDPSLT